MHWEKLNSRTVRYIIEKIGAEDFLNDAMDGQVDPSQLSYIRSINQIEKIQFDSRRGGSFLALSSVLFKTFHSISIISDFIYLLTLFLLTSEKFSSIDQTRIFNVFCSNNRKIVCRSIINARNNISNNTKILNSNIIEEVSCSSGKEYLCTILSRYDGISSFSTISDYFVTLFPDPIYISKINNKVLKNLIIDVLSKECLIQLLPYELLRLWEKKYKPSEFKVKFINFSIQLNCSINESIWVRLVTIENDLYKFGSYKSNDLIYMIENQWFNSRRTNENQLAKIKILKYLISCKCFKKLFSPEEILNIFIFLDKNSQDPLEDKFIIDLKFLLSRNSIEKYSIYSVINTIKFRKNSSRETLLKQLQYFLKAHPHSHILMTLIGFLNLLDKNEKKIGILQIKTAIICSQDICKVLDTLNNVLKCLKKQMQNVVLNELKWLYKKYPQRDKNGKK